MNAQLVLSSPSLRISAHWLSSTKNPASLYLMTRHASTVGPTLWARCLCPPEPTLGWWTWGRAGPLRSGSATPLWSGRALGMRPGWVTTASHGCCPTTMETTPTAMQERRSPCRWWRGRRRSACCWTGRVRRCYFMSRTLTLCCTPLHSSSTPPYC